MKNSKIKILYLIISVLSLFVEIDMVPAQGKAKIADVLSSQEIMFTNGTWQDVSAAAEKSGKYIFVDAYTSWCAPCRQLKKVTFRDKAAAAYYNGNFINYSVDMEKGEGIELAGKWDVKAYPTLLFFTPEGEMVMKKIGYVDGTRLVELGKQALAGK